MGSPAGDIDWVAVERRQRRRDALVAPGIIAFFVGMVLLTGRFAFWTGSTAWAAAGVFLASVVLMAVASHLIPRLRIKGSAGYRIQAAVRHHVDPGPELRVRADQQARYLAGIAWTGWAPPLATLGILLGGDWDRPTLAVPGAVLLVAGTLGWVMRWRSGVHAARRWLADPPGPPREAPPLTTAERWIAGRRGLAMILGLVLALSLILLVGVLVGVAVLDRP